MDLDLLLKLRLVVGRFGEMDLAKWWNTKGQLGKYGQAALLRGFPRTHAFAQARSVFAVAAQRCKEVFDPPDSATLWRLDEQTEEAFDSKWERWLDHASEWRNFFEDVQAISATDLAGILKHFGLIETSHTETLAKMRRSAEGRAVPLSQSYAATDEHITLLALGFARGEAGALAVPYSLRQR
jgi:hypothetical protein